jgi:Fe2+ transport system protein FeoA
MYDEVNIYMSLNELKPGESGIIEKVEGEGALRRRLLDMGLTPGTRVAVRKVAPFGDPYELFLRGYELTLRGEDARTIQMRRDPR